MLNSSLYYYSHAYTLCKKSLTFKNRAVTDTDKNNSNIEVIFKNGAPFEKFLTEINITQVINSQYHWCWDINLQLVRI